MPTPEEWSALQGGKPTVERRGGMNYIVHDYEGGDGMVVPTHNLNMGKVLFNVLGRVVTFPIALVRALHGAPCESRSRQMGGDSYDRR